MFGEDAFAASVADLVGELRLAGRVDLRGFQADVPAELAEMDVLVHASIIPEPFGHVVVEGMAAGLPVVAADAGGPAEVVDHGRTGLLTPPGDVGALAAQLRELRDDPALRLRLSVTGEQASLAYAPEVIGAEFTAVYRAVLAARQPARTSGWLRK